MSRAMSPTELYDGSVWVQDIVHTYIHRIVVELLDVPLSSNVCRFVMNNEK